MENKNLKQYLEDDKAMDAKELIRVYVHDSQGKNIFSIHTTKERVLNFPALEYILDYEVMEAKVVGDKELCIRYFTFFIVRV